MRLQAGLLVMIAGLAVTSAVTAQQTQDFGPEVLCEQIKWRQYTVRILGPEEMRWESRIEFRKGDEVVHEQHEEEMVEFLKRSPMLCDVNGDKEDELVLETFSGGAHCCFTYIVYTLKENPAELGRLGTRDAGAMLRDEDDDGVFEFHTADMAFAYFGTSFAGSVSVPIVVCYRAGAFHLADHFMRKPALSETEWEDRIKEVRADWHDKQIMDYIQAEGWKAPPSLWRNMLDFIYSGNGDLAWKFLDEVWPSDQPGKEVFRKDFEAQLAKSDFYDDILKMNGWVKRKEEGE